MEKPKYFVVKRDSDNPLWMEYINWLRKTYGCFNLTGDIRDGYYGYDGNNEHRSGTDIWFNISKFQNNPVLLTLKEWYDLFISDKPTQQKQKQDVFSPQEHYNNEHGSLYSLAEKLGLNHWEFDIFKRLVRCRKKGQFAEDLQKIKDTCDIYLQEFTNKSK